MIKCLLWGCGGYFQHYINLVKYHEMAGHFNVLGVTADVSIYSEVRGYKFISKNELGLIEFDIIIIMATGKVLREIYEEALKFGIKDECIFTYNILIHDNFSVDKYMQLKKNPPSIFANNCWGGLTYHSLDLQFTSPLINMFESAEDYLKLVKKPKEYMREDLEFIKLGYDEVRKSDYPIVRCNDIILHFNHYKSFEEAKKCWERRKSRINWDNLFVMMFTEEREIAEEFVKLPYKKKVCFVPFETKENALIYVEFGDKLKGVPFWKIVNGMAMGTYPYYDVFELLQNAQLKKIVEV